MALTIRVAEAHDREVVLDLAARAWDPVFASVNEALGARLAARLHGDDWRTHHRAEVVEILDSPSTVTWVADAGGSVVGFASARVVDPHRRIGEVRIVGVDPAAARTGVGAALTRHAEAWLRDQAMGVAFIGTGGDAGHAPARRLYESLGYRPFPVVQFYKVLNDEEAPVDVGGDLRAIAAEAIAADDIRSAAIFLVSPGDPRLRLAAAAGIEGPALDGLANAVRDPSHPVARALTDAGPTFDVLPVNPGGPRLRSHLPLAVDRDGTRATVGVLAVAHERERDDDARRRLAGLADRAAGVAARA